MQMVSGLIRILYGANYMQKEMISDATFLKFQVFVIAYNQSDFGLYKWVKYSSIKVLN